jgi:hypothetical protein
VKAIDGYRLHRLAHLEDKVRWNTSPPRMMVEEAALDVAAARPTEFGAIEVLADVCQQRRTTAARMLTALEGRSRLRRRRWLSDVLRDIERERAPYWSMATSIELNGVTACRPLVVRHQREVAVA